MEPRPLTAAERAAVLARLAADGVDSSYEIFVVRHAMVDDTTWRWCCGSNCDPCVEQLGRAVDLARGLLGCQPGLPREVPKG